MSKSRDEIITVIMKWLREKHCTLWMNWDITGDSGRRAAAEWLYDNWMDMLVFMENEQTDGKKKRKRARV